MPGTLRPDQLNQNLISQVSSEKIIRPRGFAASVIIDIITILLAIATGFAFRLFLGAKLSWIPLVSVGAVYVIIALFNTLLTKNKARRIAVAGGEVAGICAVFYDLQLAYLLLSAVVFFIFLVWGILSSLARTDNLLEFKFFQAARPVMGKYLTAFSLIAVLFYLPSVSYQKELLSQNSFQTSFNLILGGAEKMYPELQFNRSLGDFLGSFATMDLRSSPDFGKLSGSAQIQVVEEAKAKLVENLNQSLKMNISMGQTLNTVFYNFIVQKLGEWRDAFGSRFLIAWAVLLFLIARGIGAIVFWILGLLAFMIFQFLLALNVICLVGENRMREVLEYS